MVWRRRAETVIDIASFGAFMLPAVALGVTANAIGLASKALLDHAAVRNAYDESA